MELPQEQYERETGKSIWEVKNMTHTKEYHEWIKNYAKNNDSLGAKAIRKFAKNIPK